MSVYTEMLDLAGAGFCRWESESSHEYLRRLAEVADALDERGWARLSVPVQAWVNAVAEKINQGAPPPIPDGYNPSMGDAPALPAPADFFDAKGNPLKGILLINAKRKAEKAALAAAAAAPAVVEPVQEEEIAASELPEVPPADFFDAKGSPLKGLALINAKRRAQRERDAAAPKVEHLAEGGKISEAAKHTRTSRPPKAPKADDGALSTNQIMLGFFCKNPDSEISECRAFLETLGRDATEGGIAARRHYVRSITEAYLRQGYTILPPVSETA